MLADGCIEKLPNGRLAVVPVKKKSPQKFQAVQPPPTAQDWDRILIREVMLASLQREPVHLREEALAEQTPGGAFRNSSVAEPTGGSGPDRAYPRVAAGFVHPIQEEDVIAYLDVREVLELKALDLARPHIHNADLVPMLRAMRRSGKGQPPRLDNRLHEYLIAKSGNRYIRNFFRQYAATYYTSAFDYAAPEADFVAEMAAQHRDILGALIGRKWAQAREALAHHIRAQRPVLIRLLDNMASTRLCPTADSLLNR